MSARLDPPWFCLQTAREEDREEATGQSLDSGFKSQSHRTLDKPTTLSLGCFICKMEITLLPASQKCGEDKGACMAH